VTQPNFFTPLLSQALIADFMLVWLPAPSLNLSGAGAGSAAKQNAVSRWLQSCPDNAFQVSRG